MKNKFKKGKISLNRSFWFVAQFLFYFSLFYSLIIILLSFFFSTLEIMTIGLESTVDSIIEENLGKGVNSELHPYLLAAHPDKADLENIYYIVAFGTDQYLVIYINPQNGEITTGLLNYNQLSELHYTLTGKSLDSYYMERFGITFLEWVAIEDITQKLIEQLIKLSAQGRK